MRRVGFVLFCCLALAPLYSQAGHFALTDGSQVSGDPVSPYKENGVVFKSDDGSFSPRITWDKFTQDALRELQTEAKTPGDKDMVSPLLDAPPPPKPREIAVTPIDTPARPKPVGLFGLFGSPVGLFLLLVLYVANIFAAYEVAFYRQFSVKTVCGLAAIPFLGLFSPIIFLAVPAGTSPAEEQARSGSDASSEMPVQPIQTAVPVGSIRRRPGESEPAPAPAATPLATVPPVPHLPGATTPVAAASHAPAANLPPAVVYARGEYLFNRRFFETKLPGFFRVIPAENEKDLRVLIKSSRGDFSGRRITKITPGELFLQVYKDDATADEMIPFTEILEVQVRHKDLA